MFRIFLKKKLYSGQKTKSEQDANKRSRNRRLYERYPVEHLTVMNDQDILVIREMSAKGFSSDVSERAYDRFSLNDIYAARIRFHGDVQDISVKVAWKRGRAVGFELHKPSPEILGFFQRLLRPTQLAQSLSAVDAAFMRDQHAGMLWFHGEDVDLHLWQNEEEGGLAAWRLVADQQVIEWSMVHGIKTGCIRKDSRTDLGILELGQSYSEIDAEPNAERLRFALDLISALPFPERNELEKTLEQSRAS